jgi:NTE family protein
MRALVLLGFALGLAACATQERTSPLAKIDQTAGYRFGTLESIAPRPLADTFIVVTFSGGGTRAAALASGALQGLALANAPEGGKTGGGKSVNLADQIALISSVSGGSVTAGYYGLYGRKGLPQLTSSFLKRDVQGHLVGQLFLPWTWAKLATPSYARIDALRNYFDENVYGQSTYQALLDTAAAPGTPSGGTSPERRPLIVLNASDMSNGAVFSFTQDQFDLICSDLSKLHLADAVAASAAFPVALTALTLKNQSPCPAQDAATRDPFSGWQMFDQHPRPTTAQNAAINQNSNPSRYRNGNLQLGYLNEQGQSPYVHLLDGGVSDNLGLTMPISLLTGLDSDASILAEQNLESVKRVVFVVVNARSEPDNSYGQSATPPGAISTLLTTIGSPIDGTSFQMLEGLRNNLRATLGRDVSSYVVPVDFDFIRSQSSDDGADCRRKFKNLATSWVLKSGEVDALLALGSAMVRESTQFNALMTDLGGTVDKGPSVADACKTLAATVN